MLTSAQKLFYVTIISEAYHKSISFNISKQLTILIAVFNEYSEFLHAELYGGSVAWHATADADQYRYHRVNALVQQRHR